MSLLPVEEAIARLLEGAEPEQQEVVTLADASGRVLANPVDALRTQPPFDASAMDGYAARAVDIERVPVRLAVKGVAAAGKLFPGALNPGEAIRIFTGAPVPAGADTIVIQENARPVGDGAIEVLETSATGRHIRRRGLDFSEGERLLERGRVLDPAALSLAASANHATLSVFKKPLVAIIATGDELLPPGSSPGPDQIIASNSYGVAAIAANAGARVVDLGIAPDNQQAISALVRKALDADADIIVTLGGASVGDHDLVHKVLSDLGMDLGFWKIAMRPGKPLMAGRLGTTRCLGLPGNPVASLVCSHVFLRPLIARLAGRPQESSMAEAILGASLPANDLRQDYIRARLDKTADGFVATPFTVQDSSMLRLFSDAGCLVVREPFVAESRAGDVCRIVRLR